MNTEPVEIKDNPALAVSKEDFRRYLGIYRMAGSMYQVIISEGKIMEVFTAQRDRIRELEKELEKCKKK